MPPSEDVITGLIEAGSHIAIVGIGSHGEPYVINAILEVTGLVKPGKNVTFTGTGTAADPYVISSAGGGTATAITGLISTSGDSGVTIDGSGTTADPYLLSSMRTTVTAGENITVTEDSTGTLFLNYTISADPVLPARGVPVPLNVLDPFYDTEGTLRVTRNPDGSVTLNGKISIEGPSSGGLSQAAVLPSGYIPSEDVSLVAFASSVVDEPDDVRMVVANVLLMPPNATLWVMYPAISAGEILTISLDGSTYWPVV